MMKNLKKVISAVAALALSASSFAAFALDFPDVASTASYAKAVDQLTSLGVVTGYDDGTFGPEKLVTRAEMTAMIVRALGAESQAESAANTNTQFSDVTGSHWAAGYVTVGVNAKPMFIQGMGNGIFAPDANVTYAQATTMLVRMVGYEPYASKSVWPAGYLSYGSQTGITNGVSVGNDVELNRGQVATMIDNALVDAPLLVEDKMTTDVWGNPVWDYKQMNDAQNGEWDTLLINKHKTYKVYGTVTATSKTNQGLNSDEVSFTVQRADNWDNEYVNNTAKYPSVPLAKVNVGTTDAADQLNVYAEALIQVDDNDDYTFISFAASGRSDTVTFSADDDAYDNKNYNGQSAFAAKKFYVYTDENQNKTRKYDLAKKADQGNDVVWYVNGVELNDFSEADFTKYVRNNKTGSVTLIDSMGKSSASSPDGYYDTAMITYYADAIVDSVQTSSTDPIIYFEDYDPALGSSSSSLKVETDEKDKTYTFKLGTPEESKDIKVEELEKDDVLSIAWDVTANKLADSNFVNVYVSRDTVDGSLSSKNVEKGLKIGDSYYKGSALLGDETYANFTAGEDYTLYLNAFGKVVNFEEGISTKLYGVLDRVYESAGGTRYVRIITGEGKKAEYELNKQNDNTLFTTIQGYMTNAEAANQRDGKDLPQYRVINYTVNANNYITVKGEVAPVAGSENGTDLEYRASSNRLGSIKLSENTVMLDLSDYLANDKVAIASTLVDEDSYEAYAYNKSKSDSTFGFVLLLDGSNNINAESPIAVFASAESVSTVDQDQTVQANVYTKKADSENKAQYLVADPENDEIKDAFNTMVAGTVFLYKTNSEGYVTAIEEILTVDKSYTTFVDGVFATAEASHDFNDVVKAYAKNDEVQLQKGNKKGYFAFGPVMEKSSNTVDLGTLTEENKTLMSKVDSYTFEDANVYVYDFNVGGTDASKRVGDAGVAIFTKTFIEPASKEGVTGDIINWTATNKANAKFALIKVVDNTAVEGYAILPDND